MRKFKIIDAVFLSFYEKILYIDVFRNWKGMGFVYLWVIIFVFSLPELIKMQRFVTDWVTTRGPGVTIQVPDIWFSGGTLHHDSEVNPVVIIDPVTQMEMALLDTNMNELILPDSNIVAMIGRKELLINNGRQVQRFSLNQFEYMRLTADDVAYWFSVVSNWFVILIAPFLLLQAFIIQVLTVAFIALLSWIYLKIYVRNIPYSAIFRVAAVASTPMLFWQALSGLFPELLGGLSVLSGLIGVVYIFYASIIIRIDTVKELKRNKTEMKP